MNGKKVGGNANICKFTAYVSPYFVVSNGGAYTKHIYAASQRIASKLGNEDGFGADPRRVEQAGGKKISDIQKDNIGARYKELGFTYSAPEKEKVEKDSSMDSEAEEKLIFFYHPDHLGSTSYVTDADGNIAQHIEYIPYGEVFVEERNSQFSTNFLFNAKELDNETGLYYYGARYLDPMGAMWLSVDPLFEKYAGMSPYNYCAGNPVNATDPTGMFKVKQYSDEELNNFNLERSELERFESIVKNADKLLNQQVLDVINKTTGVSVDQIKKDFKYGDGPTIAITSTWLAEGNNETITICADAIKWLASTNASDIDDKAKCKMLSRNVMAVAMFIFHEYGHIGDQRTNGGMNSGQKSDGMNDDCDVDYGSTKSIREGKQEWKRAKTGHRGIDVTKLGFKEYSGTNRGQAP
ncbi:MAG: RHS repeat-associated core domain-containing protein, partial [Bacillota bacterium]|nr:RHS repeat-associated core domain-containing protein [Bacillota bacterium]